MLRLGLRNPLHWCHGKHRRVSIRPVMIGCTPSRRVITYFCVVHARPINDSSSHLKSPAFTFESHLLSVLNPTNTPVFLPDVPTHLSTEGLQMAQSNRPESIAGGCLCGAIRFTVVFPNESDWPPKNVRSSNARCRYVDRQLADWLLPLHHVS
jgi:hypothetical protein